jgi:hypothetical protein
MQKISVAEIAGDPKHEENGQRVKKIKQRADAEGLFDWWWSIGHAK